ncbi:MAG TPA: LLM class flavin-dependent oxidoreductase [Candidatus Dormibacteraeota bacterium]|nr:LLM class flavin-dependent oxidoreductase [Candidatus Dormibacteraeota bacterium]
MSLAVSIGISPRQSLASWADLGGELEAEGVDELWLIDSQLAMKDVYAGLLLAAQRTSRMLLGTGVTNPLTRHPTVTASAIAAVAEVSGGRAALGLGAGDSAVYGLGWRPARVAQVEAALRFFRAVLRGDEGEWEGRTYRLPHAPGPVPVWLAASQRRMCGLAGRLADGVILMGPASEAHVRRQVGWVGDGLGEAGRDRREITIRLVATMAASDDRAAALDAVRSWASTEARLIAGFAELPGGLESFRDEIDRARAEYDYAEHLSTHAGHRFAVSDGLAAALAVAGTPDECGRRIAGLLRTGVDGCIFPLLGGGRRERLRVLRDQVLPASVR